MGRRLLAVCLVLAAIGAATPVGARDHETVVVHAGRSLGPSNQRLVGLGWNDGSLDAVEELDPHQIRVDASLQNASPGPDVLDLSDVKIKLERVRAAGAEPLVILSYMPAWLGAPRAYGRDPTRVAPDDFDAWEALIVRVVRELATSSAPAYRFEVWNEPNIPIFWQDSVTAFVETALRTHRAVAAVAAETGLRLEVGGPVTAFPDPVYLFPYVAAVREAGLPLDFVSWHYYGNYPFLGPDGAEDIVPEPVRPLTAVWGQRNPATTPSIYRWQTDMMRSWVDAASAGSALDPELWITEWNLSAGGYDVRHDTHEGAAFAAGVLVEMEQAGLGAADYYRAAGSNRPGDWGLVTPDGERKPAWFVFDAWQKTAGERVEITGDDPGTGLWARATTGDGRLDVVLVNFVASGGDQRSVALEVDGACVSEAEVRAIDGGSGSFGEAEVRSPDDLTLTLGAQSVTWVRFAATC